MGSFLMSGRREIMWKKKGKTKGRHLPNSLEYDVPCLKH